MPEAMFTKKKEDPVTAKKRKPKTTFDELKDVLPQINAKFAASHPRIIAMLLEGEKCGVCKLLTGIACYMRQHPDQFPQPTGNDMANQIETIVNQYTLNNGP